MTACSSSGGSGSPSASALATTDTATTRSAPSAAPAAGTVAARCGAPTDSAVAIGQWKGPGGAVLPHASVGRGDTAAVFLHQTDGDGLCGWWPYASWAAAHYPMRAVIVDLCDYGKASCPTKAFDQDQLAQVAFVVRQVRATNPKRLVLVGASMGGALALAAGTSARANAVVDLSGPPDWTGAPALPATRRLRAPLLVASSPGDPSTDYAALRAAFATARAVPKKFVRGDGEHGWALLSATGGPNDWQPLARTVGRWIVGDYR